MADVFISYSRKDIAFARLIREALQQSEIDPWIDWERIPIGEKWWNEICAAIQAANTFVFIISRNSIGSPVCREEINLALENHKRIIPIAVDDLKPEAIREFAPDLPHINWIVFEKDHIFQLAENPAALSERPEDRQVALPKLPHFEQALEKLTKAIHTDWDWVKAHTNLQVDALRWTENQRNPSYLLRGEELEVAEHLLLRAAGKDPQPTGLQAEFVSTSRQEETRRQQEDLRVQQEKLSAEQKASRRQRMVIWAVGFGLLIAATLGVVSWSQRNQYLAETHVRATAESNALSEASSRATAQSHALHQQATAEAASTQAVEERNEAQLQSKLALAGKLAAQSQLLFKDQLDLALLLGVEASKTADTIEAQLAPRLALEASPRLRLILKNEFSGPRPFAISPDGKTLAIEECNPSEAYVPPGTHCDPSRIVFVDAATGQPTSDPLDLGKYSVGYLAYNALDGGKTMILVGIESIAVWDLQTRSLVGEYPTGVMDTRLLPTAAAFSPDGKLVAIGSCEDRSQGGDGNGYCNEGDIRLWSIETRQLVGKPVAAHIADVQALAFSPDSRTLASAGDQTIQHWAVPNPGSGGEAQLIGDPIQSTDTVTHTLAFSPDGKMLAAGGSENRITLWDLASPSAPAGQIMGHTYWVSALQFSPDGKTLASGSWDDTLLLWDVASREATGQPLMGHTGDVLNLRFSADGQELISTDANGALIVWDTSLQFAGSPLGRVVSSPNWGSAVWTQAFSPDGKIMAYSYGMQIHLWDLQKNQPLGSPLDGHQADIRSLVFPPQDHGQRLVSASRDGVSITWDIPTGKVLHQTGQDRDTFIYSLDFSRDGTSLVYKSNRGAFLLHLPGDQPPQEFGLQSENGRIDPLAISSDGSLAAVSVCDNPGTDQLCSAWDIQVWDLASNSPAGPGVESLPRRPLAAAFSPDGQTLAYSLDEEGSIFHLNRMTGSVSKMMSTPPPHTGRKAAPDRLVFSPGGEQLAACYRFGSMLILWDTITGEMIGKPFLDQYNIRTAAFSPDGRVLAWPLENAPFYWDIPGQKALGQPLHNGDAGGSLAFSPDGRRVAMGGGIGKSLEHEAQVFDAATGAPVTQPLIGHIGTVEGLGFTGDGQGLYTLSQEGTLNLWDLAGARVIAQPLAGYLGNFAKVDLTPDGRAMAIVACKVRLGDDCLESELWLEDTQTGERVRQPLVYKGSVTMVRFSHDARLLAITSGEQVLAWRIADQKELFSYSYSEANRDIDALAFSPDDRLLAIKSEAVVLLDTQTGKPVGEPILDKTASSRGVPLAISEDWGIAFSPDGRWLATTGSVSGSLMLVEPSTGQPYGPLLLDPRNQMMSGMMLSVTFSPDGKQLVSGNNLGTAFLWDIDPAAWRDLACRTAGRALTPEEWAVYLPVSEPYRPTCP